MINIIIYFIIIIGFWSFITILSKGPKSYETLIIIKDIFFSTNELIKKMKMLIKLLIQDLIQEKKIYKATKETDQVGNKSTIDESNYAEIINRLYIQFYDEE